MDWRRARFPMSLASPPNIRRISVGADDKRSPHYQLPDHWYVHLYSFEGEVRVDDLVLPIRPGYAGVIPPGARVKYRFPGRVTHLFAHFTLADAGAGERVSMPAMRDLGEAFLPTADRFHEAIGFFIRNPTRAAARLWDILWELAQPAPRPDVPAVRVANPIVRRACEHIEQFLARRVSVGFLAGLVEVSADHLARLFRQELGVSVVGYIRRRRVLRARHLLLHSSLPLKVIADQVGVPDPHYFNKIIRRELGASPREVRRGGRG